MKEHDEQNKVFRCLLIEIVSETNTAVRDALIQKCVDEIIFPLARHWHAMAFYTKSNPGNIELGDLVHEGEVTFLESLKEFDSRGTSISDDSSKAAHQKIFEAIERAVLEEESFEDFNRKICERLGDLVSTKAVLTQKLGRPPSPLEIANGMEIRDIRAVDGSVMSRLEVIAELERILDIASRSDIELLARETMRETVAKIIRENIH